MSDHGRNRNGQVRLQTGKISRLWHHVPGKLGQDGVGTPPTTTHMEGRPLWAGNPVGSRNMEEGIVKLSRLSDHHTETS